MTRGEMVSAIRKKRLMDQFVKDRPVRNHVVAAPTNLIRDPIAGCVAIALVRHADSRGQLIELLTTRGEAEVDIPHVYQVFAEPGSVRGWVYHAEQTDRLAYTNGQLRVILHDIREDSPTFGRTNELMVGEDNPLLLFIPPFVAHILENIGETLATFVNLPSRAWDPTNPDKYRLPMVDGILPYPERTRR